MKLLAALGLCLALLISSAPAAAKQGGKAPAKAAAKPAARPEIYHVLFAKAVPGQAAALGEIFKKGDPKATPGHSLVLRHQQGDDWDYCLIEHLGPKATVEAGGPAAPNPARDLIAWHGDTFVAGPPWADFARAMAMPAGAGDKAADFVYSVAVWRALPGHREQLEQLFGQKNPPTSKVAGAALLQHLEGAPWNYLVLERYKSWQDFATEQSAPKPAGQDGWNTVRQHSTFHHDTLADRLAP